MNKQQKLDELELEIVEKNICSELATGATQLVMGSGNPDADIVLVGEAPGRSEDEQGLPFVGASGKFLDVMLEGAGLSRDDIYITNIVKYRPPNNRDPSIAEKAEFWPYLIRQIEIIQPRAIVTLGRHSGAAFLPDLHISDDHGRPHWVELGGAERLIVPLYHPAAALYNGKLRQTLLDDFCRLPELVGD